MSSKLNKKIRLSSIYQTYFGEYLKSPKYPISKEVFKAVNQTVACRTSRIGIRVYQCSECEETKHVLRSCKNRFCPTCGYVDTQNWAKKMVEKIADCAHHHIVFTLPGGLRKLGRMNKNAIHSLLLKSSAETIIDWFDAKHNIKPGIMNVLHTAGSDQKYHPHAHMICSAGGLTEDNEFIKLKENWYLINQGFLSKKFRWHFEKGLFKLYEQDSLIHDFTDLADFKSFIKSLNQQDWVVSVQPSLKKIDDVVNYAGRYTKRACISEYNIKNASGGKICFTYKDYKKTNHKGKAEISEITLGFRDFFGRLFEHVPSKGFRMVRYYGLYSSKNINKIPQIDKKNKGVIASSWRSLQIEKTGNDPLVCPCCKKEMNLAYVHYNTEKRPRWVHKNQLSVQSITQTKAV